MHIGKILCVASLVVGATCSGRTAQQQDQWISIQNVHLQKGERVNRIEISLKAGSFVAVESLPMGWHMIIDNDASQKTTFSGDIHVGSAAVRADDLRRLRFRAHKMEFGDDKFSISGTLSVTKDFQKQREISLDATNFRIANATDSSRSN